MSLWLQKEAEIIDIRRKSSFPKFFSKNKPKLSFAAECIKKLQLSSEELEQFDAEMMAEPLVFIENGKRGESSIYITKHYFRAAFLYRGEIDYGIFRLSDIAMTHLIPSKNPSILKPTGRIYDIYILDGKGKRMGGVSLSKEEDFKNFNAALEKYAPNIRLNVSTKELTK